MQDPGGEGIVLRDGATRGVAGLVAERSAPEEAAMCALPLFESAALSTVLWRAAKQNG